jgi:hypothetical protein
MAPWLIPALKVVLPHLGTLVSVAAPVFTKKRGEAASQAQTLQDQVVELQTAASQNAEHIRELAAQLQATVSALEQAATMAEARMRRLTWLCFASLAASIAALAFTVFR